MADDKPKVATTKPWPGYPNNSAGGDETESLDQPPNPQELRAPREGLGQTPQGESGEGVRPPRSGTAAREVLDNLAERQEAVRQYDTGATRDTDEGKLKYEGFLSPIAVKRFAEYMHKHRVQSDGQLRDPDNWQKGIPIEDYVDSMFRHFVDVWLWNRGFEEEMEEEIEDALCAVVFNAQGLLFEILTEVPR